MSGDKDRSRSKRDDDRRDRKREGERDKKRHRESKTRRSRSRSRSPREVRADSPDDPRVDYAALLTQEDRAKCQRDLELQLMRNRERIEQERQQKKRQEYKEEKEKVSDKKEHLIDNDDELAERAFEDDDFELEMEVTRDDSDEDDEVDPLDAYMATIENQVKPSKKTDNVKSSGIIVVDEEIHPGKNVGEIIEREDTHEGIEADDFDINAAASQLMTKGRSLQKTDHEKVYYKPFRKDFYHEAQAIKELTKKEVETFRKENEGIRVRGSKCPKPILTWAHAGVSKIEMKILQKLEYAKPTPIQSQAIPAILSGRDVIGIAKTGSGKTKIEMKILQKLEYAKPTPIQSQAIPAILSGRDVIGIAKTGSGKTLAFLLPMFRHILDQEPLDEMDGPIGLIMAPTRELALQTWKEAKKFATPMNLNVVCVYGGVGISEQIADLKKGAEIVVCTPGRMIDMLIANNGKVTNLRRITYLVLDEADRMFDMGFEPQVMKIINNIRPDRQTVMFSATFPKTMEALARKVLEKPIEIQVGGRSVVCKDIEQHALILTEDQKFLKLLELLGIFWERGNVIVFVEKQEKADDLVTKLMKAGYNCAPLHGAIDQSDRDSALIDFKQGILKLLVATSVAARGLDVKKLILVVNYDCPNHYEDYVHRVGRTGRAGNKGYAYTFILPENQERYAGEVCRAFETAELEPPAPVKEMWEKFKAEMKEKGIDVHAGGGGYSGSGYKYDSDEDEAIDQRKKLTKLVSALENNDDDDEIETQLTNLVKTKKRTQNVEPVLGEEIDAKVAAARSAADKLGLSSSDADQGSAQVLSGENGSELTPSQIARQKAMALNDKLNYTPSARPREELFGQQFYEAEMEINDFPQQVRFRVCSRESIAQIQEFADVGISVKGTHIPPGKEPKDGERKLYLFLEARDEVTLRRAQDEVLRIIKESLKSMLFNKQQPGGRYRVL
uniref:ATP-dependent RNA helicase n=1 Tax=Panagrolaimus sp. JU765 TaxID=591449 RepID=A0AC34QFV3_9BILA